MFRHVFFGSPQTQLKVYPETLAEKVQSLFLERLVIKLKKNHMHF